jgi:hypothetical protein
MDQYPAVGPRVPKDEFMRALGLDHQNPTHENYYRQMRVGFDSCSHLPKAHSSLSQEVAIAVYNRMNQDRSNLIDEKRGDPECRPPFFWHHIRNERRRCGILETWQQAPAGSMARTLFDRGQTSGEHAPNWVTLWLLYSVFRSRDFRNNRNRRNGDDRGDGGNGRSGKNPHLAHLTELTTKGQAPATVEVAIQNTTTQHEMRIWFGRTRRLRMVTLCAWILFGRLQCRTAV